MSDLSASSVAGHPPPPAAARRRRAAGDTPLRNRLVALAVLLPAAALLLLAAGLEPDPRGFGTHEQIGLPVLDASLRGCAFKGATGLPCATCGMTTSFSHAAHGQLVSAFAVQPAGAALAIATAMAAVVSGLAVAFGFSLAPLGRWLARPATVLPAGAALLAGWAYKLTMTLGF